MSSSQLQLVNEIKVVVQGLVANIPQKHVHHLNGTDNLVVDGVPVVVVVRLAVTPVKIGGEGADGNEALALLVDLLCATKQAHVHLRDALGQVLVGDGEIDGEALVGGNNAALCRDAVGGEVVGDGFHDGLRGKHALSLALASCAANGSAVLVPSVLGATRRSPFISIP